MNPIEIKKVNAHRDLLMKTSGHLRGLRNLRFMGLAFVRLGLRLASAVSWPAELGSEPNSAKRCGQIEVGLAELGSGPKSATALAKLMPG